MKQYLGVLAALVVSTLVACGGTEPVEAPEALEQQSSALVTCSTTCTSGSVTCTGVSCSASDGQFVQCDGNYTYCPLPEPECTDSSPLCVSLNGRRCSPAGSSRPCCMPGAPNGGCFCRSNGTWICTIPAEGP
ncbi:hypothetical protein ACLESD_49275 [Pyxidicoccus sp. 3LFB2]